MMNHFRRNALQLTLAALFSSAFYAQAADIPQVKSDRHRQTVRADERHREGG